MSSSDLRTHHGPRRPGIGVRQLAEERVGSLVRTGTAVYGPCRPERGRGLVRCNPVHTTAPPALEARPISSGGRRRRAPAGPYAGALDGLRGVAVLGVVAFHVGHLTAATSASTPSSCCRGS